MSKSIDIIIPCFNDGRIYRLLESVYNASGSQYVNCIILEASNNQEFQELLRNYIRINDTLLCEPDCGIFDGFNKGLSLSSSNVVCMLGADDKFGRNFDFSVVLERIENVDILIPKYRYFSGDQTKRVVDYKLFKWWHYFAGKPFYHPGTFIKGNIARKFSFEVSSRLKYCADYKYFMSLFLSERPIIGKINSQVDIETGGVSGTWKARLYNFFQMLRESPIALLALTPMIFLVRYSYKIEQSLRR